MSELQININLDNAAFGDNPAEEVARILENYCKNLNNSGELVNSLNDKYNFIDYNGNSVGEAKIIEELPELTEKQPKVLLTVKSGLVQAVHSDTEIKVVILDLDCQDTVKDMNGQNLSAEVFKIESELDAKLVNHYFNQV